MSFGSQFTNCLFKGFLVRCSQPTNFCTLVLKEQTSRTIMMLFKDKTNCSFYLRKLFNKSTLTKTLEPHICLLFPSFLSAKARQAPFNTEWSFPSNFSKRQFWPHSHSKQVVLGQLDICRTTTCNILQDKPHLKKKKETMMFPLPYPLYMNVATMMQAEQSLRIVKVSHLQPNNLHSFV